MTPDNSTSELSLGDSVIDREDDDPNEAIVIWQPEDRTIIDWKYETDAETVTTAEENPAYPDDEQLVVVAFRTSVADEWPDWWDVAPDTLYESTAERDITQYGFPESRLESIESGELDVHWLNGLATRLADVGWDVTQEPTELVVKQFDDEYRITADGRVEGDGEFRTPLKNLIEMEQS